MLRISSLLSLLLFLLWIPSAKGQTVCNAAGNLMIYSNYDGGIVTINVDVNISNLKIGICTYEPVQVSLTGPFVGNVTQVVYAGFNSTQGNNNCNLGDFPTNITGVNPSLITINTYPSVGLSNPNGWPNMVCAVGSCDPNQTTGGCNTPDQIVYYFQQATGGVLYGHQTQYNCWLNTQYSVSNAGNCCAGPTASCTPPQVDAGTGGSICQGGSLVLGGNPSASGGSPSNYTYSWAPATGLNDPTIANPIASPDANTTYTLTVSTGPNCSTSASVDVQIGDVQSLPVTFDGDLILCAGETATLTAASGFSNYQWSNGSSGANLTVSDAGTYSATAQSADGCPAASASYTFTEVAPFQISIEPSGPITVCDNEPVMLQAEAGFSGYVWSNQASGPSLTVNETGGYSVSAFSPEGCPGASAVVDVTVLPLPIAAFSYNQLNETDFTVQFQNQSLDAETYTWNFGSGNTSTASNPSFDFLFDAVWPVSLIAGNACGFDTVLVQVEVIKTGIEDAALAGIRVLRSENQIWVTGGDALRGSWTLSLYRADGALIEQRNGRSGGIQQESFRIPSAAGWYVIRIQSGTAQRSIKLIATP